MADRFTKMHGLGNDFVVIDAREHAVEMTPARAHAIADRRHGIGCDQLILLEPSASADVKMRIFNADGSDGDGGKIVLWSDDFTRFAGAISATGGGTGKGGLAEVSGHRLLDFIGSANLTGVNGNAGKLLLDPSRVVISYPTPSGIEWFTRKGVIRNEPTANSRPGSITCSGVDSSS